VSAARFRIEWASDAGALVAIEPTRDEVAAHAAALAHAYNDPANARLLGHDEPLGADEVASHFTNVRAEGGRAFLMFRDGALAGDADLRHVRGNAAEFAFLVATPAEQGKGLGTKLAQMVHALAFARLELARVYVSIVPDNVASRRVFEKLGYAVDATSLARAFAEEPTDVVMSIDRATFERANAAALAQIRIAESA
jgi:RimJ/RimL family protein N-acetyltransferase